jgi:hypothetical protein
LEGFKGCVSYEDLDQDRWEERRQRWIVDAQIFLLCGNGGYYLRASEASFGRAQSLVGEMTYVRAWWTLSDAGKQRSQEE